MSDDLGQLADEKRKLIVQNAALIGIDEAFISRLVDTFYGRLKLHPTLGPIFVKAIGHEWESHLAKIKLFWESVALNAGKYKGQPVPVHRKHTEIQLHHFDIWLGVFEETLNELATHPEAVQYMMERANRIAQSLQFAMFGLPELRS